MCDVDREIAGEREVMFEGLDGDADKVGQSLALIINTLGWPAIEAAWRLAIAEKRGDGCG